MKRVLILVAVLVGGAYVYEVYSGRDIGVVRSFEVTRNAVAGGFAGGYGMATGVGRSVGNSAGGLAGGVSNSMGAVFGN